MVAEQFYNVRNLREASILASKTHEDLYGVQAIPQISSDEDEEYNPEEDEEMEVLYQIFFDQFNFQFRSPLQNEKGFRGVKMKRSG